MCVFSLDMFFFKHSEVARQAEILTKYLLLGIWSSWEILYFGSVRFAY